MKAAKEFAIGEGSTLLSQDLSPSTNSASKKTGPPGRWWRRPVVTVVWMPHTASLFLWEADRDGARYPSDSREVLAENCGDEQYRKALEQLLDKVPRRGCRIHWICPLDLFPATFTGSQNGGALRAQLPEWIRKCWLGLPQRLIPEQVHCGLGGVEHNLVDWELYCRPGSGFLLPLGGRFVFFGYAEGRIHHRISRAAPDLEAPSGLSEDWIQQTRMLYRSRTGVELRKILVPEALPSNRVEEAGPERRESIVEAKPPPCWPGKPHNLQEAGLNYLHACGLKSGEQAGPVLSFDFLEGKKRRERWQRGFRTATVLLIVAWMASLLAACRFGDNYSTGMHLERLEWESQHRMWEARHKEWSRKEEILNARRMPFTLVGKIAHSVPEDIILDRLQLDEDTGAGEHLYDLEIDGRCLGEEPAAILQDWLEGMKEDAVLSRIEDMQLSRRDDVLKFSIQAQTPREATR